MHRPGGRQETGSPVSWADGSDRGFRDRVHAGRQLGEAVERLELADPVVLALPRGGVPVAVQVAERLHAPIDVLVVRKVGAPHQRELAIGAVAEGDETLIDAATARDTGTDEATLADLVQAERLAASECVTAFRAGRPLPALGGRDVLVVDDGLATGLTAEVALLVVRRHAPRTLTLAIPVGAPESVDRLARVADDVVCLLSPPRFLAVGAWYDDFGQVSDEEVLSLLARARNGPAAR
jgi:predicted phosphoribosyltransferase